MPLQHAVLALLSEGPSYGYELKANFEEAIGPQWGELNIGHLYQVLDRLVRDGLVSRRVVAQTDRPDKNVYRITKRGRNELEAWLAEAYVPQSGYRDDFFLKLFAAARRGQEDLRRVCAVQRRAYLSELASLAQLRREYEGHPFVSMLIQAALLHTEANLRVVELAEERASNLTSSSQSSKLRHPAARAGNEGKAS